MNIQQRRLIVRSAFLAILLFCASYAIGLTAPMEITLHQFRPAAPANGGNPYAGVVIGDSGVLYGTTVMGGTAGHGTVFSLTPPITPGSAWHETVLHSFAGSPADGGDPGALAIGPGGILYGTTYNGGTSGVGTVFALTPPGGPNGEWTETVLHNFVAYTSADGSYPDGGVVIGADGTLCGTTLSGGASLLYGTVFSLTPPASPGGEWTEAILHSFSGSDGDGPTSRLAIGKYGVLYGTTQYGGAGPCDAYAIGCGVVFSLTPPASPGGSWTETVLHNFTGIPDGAVPGGGVAIGKDGVLYGVTENGGSYSCGGNLGCGAVFALAPPIVPGGPWREAILYNFGQPGRAVDGVRAQGTLAIGGRGVLYGTTYGGGVNGGGLVYALAPPASPGGAWIRTPLYSFPRPSSGTAYPAAGVVIGASGVLYGTTYGVSNVDTGTVFAVIPRL